MRIQHHSSRQLAARRTTLTLADVQALIETLLSQDQISGADLLAFARSVNGGDFSAAPAAKPRPAKGPSVMAIKQQVLAHFACSSVTALKKNRNF